jgi:hypothetical protein
LLTLTRFATISSIVKGDLVEFWSGEGMWKPALVVDMVKFHTEVGIDHNLLVTDDKMLRLQTGPDIFIIRSTMRRGISLIRPKSSSGYPTKSGVGSNVSVLPLPSLAKSTVVGRQLISTICDIGTV